MVMLTKSEQKMNKQIQQFDEALATLKTEPPPVELQVIPQVPEAVSRFCDQIDKNFSSTVEQLEATAQAMHLAASELESRAKQLKEAGPDVSEEVKKWIMYERESREKQKFYSSIFQHQP